MQLRSQLSRAYSAELSPRCYLQGHTHASDATADPKRRRSYICGISFNIMITICGSRYMAGECCGAEPRASSTAYSQISRPVSPDALHSGSLLPLRTSPTIASRTVHTGRRSSLVLCGLARGERTLRICNHEKSLGWQNHSTLNQVITSCADICNDTFYTLSC